MFAILLKWALSCHQHGIFIKGASNTPCRFILTSKGQHPYYISCLRWYSDAGEMAFEREFLSCDESRGSWPGLCEQRISCWLLLRGRVFGRMLINRASLEYLRGIAHTFHRLGSKCKHSYSYLIHIILYWSLKYQSDSKLHTKERHLLLETLKTVKLKLGMLAEIMTIILGSNSNYWN